MSPGANGPYPRCEPGMTTTQKEHFLGRAQLAPPHLSFVLHYSPRMVKGDLSTSHPRILNHGLTIINTSWKSVKKYVGINEGLIILTEGKEVMYRVGITVNLNNFI